MVAANAAEAEGMGEEWEEMASTANGYRERGAIGLEVIKYSKIYCGSGCTAINILKNIDL